MNLLDHHSMRRTKIITTLGPATDSEEKMDELISAGANIVRLNFSHGSHDEHLARINNVRRAAKKLNIIVGILADLQGPKIRVASFKNKKIELANGATFILDAGMDANAGDETAVGIDYKELPQDVSTGDTLLLDDGRLTFTVDKVEGEKIYCTVETGGVLSDHKGINRKGGGLSAKALTEKDIKDLEFALKQNIDYVAISFPRNKADIDEAHELIEKFGGKAGVIAKIERTEAMENIEEIIEASDGVMVARGDLAVEIGDAAVPLAQKTIIHKARCMDKPVITATQMMESMITSTVPTRAEVSDVANAVLANTDAVMLSAESAVGDHPALVVETMARICVVSESDPTSQVSAHRVECQFDRIDEALAMSAMYAANHLNVEAIIALTESGQTTLWMSRLRTGIPVYGLSQHQATLGRMTMYRGVYPVAFDTTQYSCADVDAAAVAALKAQGQLTDQQIVVLTKGDSLGVCGGSNALKILTVGEVA